MHASRNYVVLSQVDFATKLADVREAPTQFLIRRSHGRKQWGRFCDSREQEFHANRLVFAKDGSRTKSRRWRENCCYRTGLRAVSCYTRGLCHLRRAYWGLAETALDDRGIRKAYVHDSFVGLFLLDRSRSRTFVRTLILSFVHSAASIWCENWGSWIRVWKLGSCRS